VQKIVECILSLQETSTTLWKKQDITLCKTGLLGLVEANHSYNFQLWNTEDKARRDDMGAEFVYQAKRAIDGFNQQRNNKMEQIDLALTKELEPSLDPKIPVHSETPGMIIDRLSILALKIYHMQLQTMRQDVQSEHINGCKHKLDILIAQREQLGICLLELLEAVTSKTRSFRMYHQMKMYNDPKLNPELYNN
jgi:Protein of unknown function (DUF4254)